MTLKAWWCDSGREDQINSLVPSLWGTYKQKVISWIGLYSTGCQCKPTKTGVIFSLFRVFVENLAAEFGTNWRRDKQDWATPKYNELQLSSLDEMNAWITVSKSLNEIKKLILTIILSWKNTDFTTEFICLSNLSAGSKITPRFLHGNLQC